MINNVIEVALSQFGVSEIVGRKDNPEVIKYFDKIGYDGAKLKDETSWCSAFVNWCAIQAGLPFSSKLTARSWLTIGTITQSPQIGDVVVLWRESRASWKGHVGFFVRETADVIYVLGGNQSGRVSIQPYSKNRLLNYIRL